MIRRSQTRLIPYVHTPWHIVTPARHPHLAHLAEQLQPWQQRVHAAHAVGYPELFLMPVLHRPEHPRDGGRHQLRLLVLRQEGELARTAPPMDPHRVQPPFRYQYSYCCTALRLTPTTAVGSS